MKKLLVILLVAMVLFVQGCALVKTAIAAVVTYCLSQAF